MEHKYRLFGTSVINSSNSLKDADYDEGGLSNEGLIQKEHQMLLRIKR